MGTNLPDIESNSPPIAENVVRETSPLLQSGRRNHSPSSSSVVSSQSDVGQSKDVESDRKGGVGAVLSLLMIGVFISNMDGSLVIATCGTISSNFSRLEDASWLITSYVLAMCAAQPVVSKLSDVFGRKIVLLVCYVVFAIGLMLSGTGQSMWHIIAGRAVSGLGGAGMGVIVSILITDLVPKIEVATWRSYVNVAATLGRSSGGPLGGWLADTVGWRWSFIVQVPLIILAFILVAYKLVPPPSQNEIPQVTGQFRSKLGRIDILGTILISTVIAFFILAIDLPSRGVSWTSPLVISLLIASTVLGVLFLLLEEKYASEPVFPPRLFLQRNVATSYFIIGLQTAAQLALMFSIPIYFQVTSGASNTAAGTHLVPAVVGNAVGGLLTGVIIKKTGKYKALLGFASLSAGACYAILILTWHGNTSGLASLAIFPGGFGSGIAGAATFIALMAYIPHADAAVATGGLYLATNVGIILGLSISSSVQRGQLRSSLVERGVGSQVVENVLKDVLYIRHLNGGLKSAVISSYVHSLSYSHGFSFLCSAVAFFVSFAIKEGDLVPSG